MEWLGMKMFKSKQLGSGYLNGGRLLLYSVNDGVARERDI